MANQHHIVKVRNRHERFKKTKLPRVNQSFSSYSPVPVIPTSFVVGPILLGASAKENGATIFYNARTDFEWRPHHAALLMGRTATEKKQHVGDVEKK
jgi:hypothetical protein